MVRILSNVIFLVPVFNCRDLLAEWSSYIRELKPKPDKIVFCENNSVDGSLEALYELDLAGIPFEIIRFWTIDPKDKKAFPFKGHCYDIIAWARELLLTRARHLDPDYAIFIDSDIWLVDPTTIDSLTLWQKDIIGGAYPRVFPEGVFMATLFYTSIRKEKSTTKGWMKYKQLPAGVPTWEVHATSAGCLCLSRKVIQDRRLSFWPIVKNYSEDFGFCRRARDNSYNIYLDGTLVLGHKITVRWRSWDVVRADDSEKSKAYDDGSLIDEVKAEVARLKRKV